LAGITTSIERSGALTQNSSHLLSEWSASFFSTLDDLQGTFAPLDKHHRRCHHDDDKALPALDTAEESTNFSIFGGLRGRYLCASGARL
jgi:hypothetical protein